jgi:hypothetical protein
VKRTLCTIACAFIGCGGDVVSGNDVTNFRVLQTPIEDCSLRPNGEFCKEPEQFRAPKTTSLTVDIGPALGRVFLEESIYLLDAAAEGVDPLTAERTGSRRFVETREPGPCTSSIEETIRFTVTGEAFSGELRSRNVLNGPQACGATPIGERTTITLSGTATLP